MTGFIGFLILSLILYLCMFSRFSQMNYSFCCCCGLKRKRLKKTRAVGSDTWEGRRSGRRPGRPRTASHGSAHLGRAPYSLLLPFPGVVAGSGLPRWVTSGEPSRLNHPSTQTQRERLP